MPVYPSSMEAFQMGYQGGPAAGIGNAIRNILSQHEKLTMAAGSKQIELQAEEAWFNKIAPTTGMGGGPPEMTAVGGQQFYKKPQYYRGRPVGSSWSPITQNVWSLFPPEGGGGGGGDMMGDTGAAPQGIDPQDWRMASPEQRAAYMEWQKSR